MNTEILWLIHLGVEEKLFTRPQASATLTSVGPNAELMDFAQRLIDDGIVHDVDRLEVIGGQAMTRAKAGPPPSIREQKAAPPETSDTGKSEPASESLDFPFEQVGAMEDHDLAAAMRQLLVDVARSGASDLHLSAGAKPFVRRHRALVSLSDHALTDEESLRLNTILLAEHQKKIFLTRRDFDLALALSGKSRFRVNLMFHKGGASGCYRMVPAVTPKLDELGLRNLETIRKMLTYHNGLILVTGPVGAGKTTTLAAMVAELNATREDHIITVEDPIEVVQVPKKCNVTQREVGPHTKSFFTALKGALREDPDVIVIGELRDLETIEMAVTASETGHLVIGTMHTSDAATTLNRLLDVFPPAQQTQIRASVAESLRGIVCQRLLPAAQGGLIVACEIMVANLAIQALIRDGKVSGLRNTMETGVKEGMCIMENVVLELYQHGRISKETALLNTTTRNVRAKIA